MTSTSKPDKIQRLGKNIEALIGLISIIGTPITVFLALSKMWGILYNQFISEHLNLTIYGFEYSESMSLIGGINILGPYAIVCTLISVIISITFYLLKYKVKLNILVAPQKWQDHITNIFPIIAYNVLVAILVFVLILIFIKSPMNKAEERANEIRKQAEINTVILKDSTTFSCNILSRNHDGLLIYIQNKTVKDMDVSRVFQVTSNGSHVQNKK